MAIRCYVFLTGLNEQFQWFLERENGDVSLVCFLTMGHPGLIPHNGEYTPPCFLDNLEMAGHIVRLG